ncbi:MAG TPA: hypothetical protein V6C95_17580 [Coleofasciculaceae cyanobacterium]
MSESEKENITIELQKAKSEGKMRAERIQGILRDAFSQILTEVKDGSGEIKLIVKDAVSENIEQVNSVDEKKEETTDKTSSIHAKSLILAIFKTLKSQLFNSLHQSYTDWPNQYAKLKNKAVDLDVKLAERYGERYAAVKQRMEKGATWYNAATVQAKATETTVLEQKQAEFENKLSEAGATVAQKEQQVKQQLKALLQTATAKV